MAQINKGFDYSTTGANSYVTAGNLNQHVANATLAGGAIAEQPANSSTNDTDVLLIGTGGGGSPAYIWKQTKAQFTNVINSNTINVNNLSVAEAEFDNLTINGTYDDAVYFSVGNAPIYNPSITSPYVMFGYDNITHALPVGHTGNVYRHHGPNTLFLDPYNPVDLNVAGTGHTVTIQGDLNVGKDLSVTKSVAIAGRPLVNSTIAIKQGVCFVGGTNTFLHETQLLDIPADETWIINFKAFWRVTGTFNASTFPLTGYTVETTAIKATYANVTLQSNEIYPTALGSVSNMMLQIDILVNVTRSDLSNLTKSIKFSTTTPPAPITSVNTTAGNGYTITLTKVKTANFNSDNSIL